MERPEVPMPRSRRVNIEIDRIEPIGRGRYRVKVRQNINLLDIRHGGHEYRVERNLGRGRMICRRIGEYERSGRPDYAGA